MSSTWGTLFRVTTFGESHGGMVGAVVDGCPPRVALDAEKVQVELDRRRPGQSRLGTARAEADRVEIVSGVEDGVTLGTPISLLVRNRDQRGHDYDEFANVPRPSHADFTYQAKYGVKATSGGGRASARETIGRVAGAAVARQWLQARGVDIVGWVSSVGPLDAPMPDLETVTRAEVDRTPARCPSPLTAQRMIELIDEVRDSSDSVGGVVTCMCRGVPAGWGDPVFDKFEASLGRAMMSIPAVKGFELGSGFAGTRLRGSEHNDMFCMKKGRIGTVTNRSGGIQGGITNGEIVYFRVAFKPTATIACEQKSVDFEGNPVTVIGHGRHDPCVLPRAVPIVEAMATLTLMDAAMRQLSIANS